MNNSMLIKSYFAAAKWVALAMPVALTVAFATEWLMGFIFSLFFGVAFFAVWLLLLPLALYIKQGGTVTQGAGLVIRGGAFVAKGMLVVIAAVFPFVAKAFLGGAAQQSGGGEDWRDSCGTDFGGGLDNHGLQADYRDYDK